jgi:hypothetical protein
VLPGLICVWGYLGGPDVNLRPAGIGDLAGVRKAALRRPSGAVGWSLTGSGASWGERKHRGEAALEACLVAMRTVMARSGR